MTRLIILFLIVCVCSSVTNPQQKTERPTMEPKQITRQEIKLIGIAVRTINEEETNPATAKIPGLWGRFFQAGIAGKIPNQISSGSTLAAYTNYESDHTGEYDLIVGREVSTLGSIPEGMTGVTIPAGKYLRFNANGPMPQTLIDTWVFIWNYFLLNSKHQRSYTTDYEVHLTDDTVDIYIAIK